MLKILFLAAVLSSAFAQPSVKIGGGEFHKLLFHVYDATLYSDDGQFGWEKPYALKLDYKMSIDGADIAERSIDEMNSIEPVPKDRAAKWLAEMKAIFPDVKKGDNITGINIPGKGAAFLKNGAKIGEINDVEFSRRFFEIWLSPKTSDKGLRSKLLGEEK